MSDSKKDENTDDLVDEKVDNKEEKKELQIDDDSDIVENVDFISKIFASRLNATLTNIGKHAMDWLVWNTNDNIYWNFDMTHSKSTGIIIIYNTHSIIMLRTTLLFFFWSQINILHLQWMIHLDWD